MAVGAKVGIMVGMAVVGTELGIVVGVIVGIIVGTKDGTAVGIIVGVEVGIEVACPETCVFLPPRRRPITISSCHDDRIVIIIESCLSLLEVLDVKSIYSSSEKVVDMSSMVSFDASN